MAGVAALPEVRRARRGHADTYGRVYYKSKAKRRWQVSFFAPPRTADGRTKELSQTVVDDRSGRVLESWTGYKVEWTMARGYAGAFGRDRQRAVGLAAAVRAVRAAVRAPAVAAAAPRPAVLLAFSVSYAFFNAVAHRRLGPARLSAARLPARAHARHRASRGRAGASRRRCA